MFLVVVFLVGAGTLIPLEAHKFATGVECLQAAAFANEVFAGVRLAFCINLSQGI
jgi:hypothetical protein